MSARRPARKRAPARAKTKARAIPPTRAKRKSGAVPPALLEARPARRRAKTPRVRPLAPRQARAIRREIEKGIAAQVDPPRWNADPEDVRRSVAKLVLTLVEFLRKLMERQAIRRMENETLSPEEIERVGLALMKLEETVAEMAAQFGLSPEELNLDLGPLGRLI